ncbi:hypothetical protein [Paucibacter sp. Y2R2-4]|uniref:hypothetical protein n=1 Tax=Paucibacter sp. Y2R2-4 TaxID=2893553 RepID=UPI0021E45C82|nr:hypothetical protein [Paucibacter sp. Y2R2-4]MCV2349331.1 hypothetical protein [Paucibacter sp. Y2R2-4]
MSTHSEQVAAPTAGLVYLVEMQFTTGTVRLCSWSHSLEALGQSWQGAGRLMSVSGLQDAEGLQYPAVDLGLAVQDPSLLALCRGSVNTYRRRPVLIYLGAMNSVLQLQGTPELLWSGLMDQVRLRTGDGADQAAQAVMRCELQGRDKRAPQSLRLNNAQHQARFPGDTFFARVEEFGSKPQPWLSIRFQRR